MLEVNKMTNGSTLNTNHKQTALHRTYTDLVDISATQYLNPTKFKVGINNGTPNVGSSDLDYAVPISDGTTNDDGSNTLTGSNGGDNSTDNTTTYKAGGGNTDVTAQNLIANDTSVTKTWTIGDLSSAGTIIDATQPFALWLKIEDATQLAKFSIAGTALEVKLGSDSSNYYSKTFVATDLAVGWNWITSNTTNVNALTETGTVSGDVDTFIVEITTNNATDTFTTGNVIYDLLRQWAPSDLIKSFETGFPSLDYPKLQATIRMFLSTVEANGFDLNGLATFNEESTPKMTGEDTYPAESKSSTDEFAYIDTDVIL